MTTYQATMEEELHGYYFEDLEEGMTEIYAKTITDADIVAFAGISGDTNPIHINQEFARGTRFEGRIAHGLLIASFISTVIGTKLPGPGCIYLSQGLKFRAPVYIGDEVVATCKITAIDPEKARVTLACDCSVNGKTVLEGEALLMVDRRAPRQ